MFTTNLLSHLFIPTVSNNQKARALHLSSLTLLIIALIFYQVLLTVLPYTHISVLGYASSIPVSDVISLTNTKRVENGLSPLHESAVLTQAARAKGQHMLANGYWAHIAPDGTEPWKFFTDAGYKYRYAGENLARDFSSPSSAVDAWMASPSHRDNLLSSKYSDIGIAVVEGNLGGVETTIIVQLFGTSYSEVKEAPKIANVPVAETVKTIVPTLAPTLIPTNIPPTPTAIITPTLFVQNPNAVVSSGSVISQSDTKVLISPFSTTRHVSLITAGLLFVILIIDAIIIRKRKIVRIGGRTFAHLAFLGMILLIAVIVRAGSIV